MPNLSMYLKVRLTEVQYAMVKAAAKQKKISASEWVRQQIAQAALDAFKEKDK